MEKKKILILSAAYPYRGGIAHFTGLLYKELSESHDTEVVTFTRQYPAVFFPGKTQMESEGEDVQKIPSARMIDSINPFNWIKTGFALKKKKPDLVIINFWFPFFGPSFGTIARIIKSGGHSKVIVICHNIIPHEKRILDFSLTKYLFKAADGFVLLAGKLEADLRQFRKEAPYVISHHPVYSVFGNKIDKSEARKHLGINQNKTMLFFGIVREYKGLDTLLEAAALLKDRMDFNLIVAGEFYSDEEKYKNLISELGLGDRVILRNEFIPADEVKYYFSASDVVVLPYRDATQSGIIQIANNFEKPVIATNVGGLGEIVLEGKTGFLVEKENPARLADAIIKYYETGSEQKFAENIKAESHKYSWKTFTENIFRLAGKSE